MSDFKYFLDSLEDNIVSLLPSDKEIQYLKDLLNFVRELKKKYYEGEVVVSTKGTGDYDEDEYEDASELSEKWGVKVVVNPKERGKWSGYDVKELCALYKKLRNKPNKTRAELGTLRELAFAIRAKSGWPKGKGPLAICGIKEGRLSEKWDVEGPVIDPEDVGKWKDYSIPELCNLWKKLRKKENKTKEDLEKIAQIVFAIRAKRYGRGKHWGPAKSVCGISESSVKKRRIR